MCGGWKRKTEMTVHHLLYETLRTRGKAEKSKKVDGEFFSSKEETLKQQLSSRKRG